MVLLSILLSVAVESANVYAFQQPTAPANKKVQVSEAFLKEAEAAIVERDSLRRQLQLERERFAVSENEKNALRAIIDIERTRADNLFKAVIEHKNVAVIDEKLFRSYEASLNDYKLERARLINERDKAVSTRTIWTIGGFVGGVLIGVLAGAK